MILYVYDMFKGSVKNMAKSFDYEITRVNYNLPTKLVERVKEYSREMGVPITYGVVLLLNKGLENSTILEQLPKVTQFIEEYKDGKFSDIKDKSS